MKRIKPSSSASQVCRQGSKKTERDIEVVQFHEPCARKSKVASSGKSNDASKRSEVNSTVRLISNLGAIVLTNFDVVVKCS